jgi:uncharacterized protein YbbK (DUF523 family)
VRDDQSLKEVRNMNILVSACLLGVRCRYSGDGCENTAVAALREKHHLIPVCPEQLGGMPTPPSAAAWCPAMAGRRRFCWKKG